MNTVGYGRPVNGLTATCEAVQPLAPSIAFELIEAAYQELQTLEQALRPVLTPDTEKKLACDPSAPASEIVFRLSGLIQRIQSIRARVQV